MKIMTLSCIDKLQKLNFKNMYIDKYTNTIRYSYNYSINLVVYAIVFYTLI